MRVLSLLFLLISSVTFSQISLNDLQRAGIKSEGDLEKLGVSQSEINDLKNEYAQTQEKPQVKKTKVAKPLPPVEQKHIVLKSPKKTVGKVNVFGQDIFRSGSISIQESSNRIKAADNYTIGSGDRISISIWGFSEFSDDFTIDDLGNISPKIVGRINLKGKSFKDAKNIIQSRFSKVYDLKNSQIGIELSYSKIISINIVGEVVSPGTFSIPGINSAFNILTLSQGPNEKGSVRNISIVRNGKIINTLDIYHFLMQPQKASFIHLNDGDFIFVPSLGNVVSINGEILNKGKFEIKEKETLFDLIQFSGGLTSNANKTNISIIRNSSTNKIVESYSFEDSKEIILKNGDEVIISKNSHLISNKITVNGEISAPGIFQFKTGETLKSVIEKANGLTAEAYLNKAHIHRLNSNLQRELIPVSLNTNSKDYSIKLKDLDEIFIFNKKSFLDTNYLVVNGLVRNPGKIEFKKNITITDLLTIVGGSYPQADLQRIEIERINFSIPQNDSINYVKIHFKDLETNGDFKLEPFDIINVRPLPDFKFQESIEVLGEVKYPGSYSLEGNKVRTSDIIKRVGGLTNLSYGKKAYIQRTEDSLGIILLDLDLVLKNNNSSCNFSLRPGDKIFIPRINDIVSISGAVGAKLLNSNDEKINVAFKQGKTASFYIKKYAGGYDYKANKRTVYAVTLNGQVKRSKIFGLIKPNIEEGDKIIVSYRPEKEKKENTQKINWNNQIESMTIKLTGLVTLWILLSNVSLN